MRKVLEALRLLFDHDRSQREIATSLGLSQEHAAHVHPVFAGMTASAEHGSRAARGSSHARPSTRSSPSPTCEMATVRASHAANVGKWAENR